MQCIIFSIPGNYEGASLCAYAIMIVVSTSYISWVLQNW